MQHSQSGCAQSGTSQMSRGSLCLPWCYLLSSYRNKAVNSSVGKRALLNALSTGSIYYTYTYMQEMYNCNHCDSSVIFKAEIVERPLSHLSHHSSCVGCICCVSSKPKVCVWLMKSLTDLGALPAKDHNYYYQCSSACLRMQDSGISNLRSGDCVSTQCSYNICSQESVQS